MRPPGRIERIFIGAAAATLMAVVPIAAMAADPRANNIAGDDPGAIRVLLASQLETTLSSQMNGTPLGSV